MFRMTFGWISLLIGYKLHLSDHLWWVPCNILEAPARVPQTGPQLLGTLESPGVRESMLSENNLKGCPPWDLPGSQENPLWLIIAESSREINPDDTTLQKNGKLKVICSEHHCNWLWSVRSTILGHEIGGQTQPWILCLGYMWDITRHPCPLQVYECMLSTTGCLYSVSLCMTLSPCVFLCFC